MIFLFSCSIGALSTGINILYEKQVANTVGETYRIYLQQHTKEINRLLKKFTKQNVEFTLQEILAFNQYVKQPSYENLSRFAGSDNLEERINSLAQSPGNYILAVSAGKDVEIKPEWRTVTPCKILFVENLDSATNYDVDLLSILHKAVLDVLASLLQIDVPNLLDKNNIQAVRAFVNDLQKVDYEKRAKECETHSDKAIDLEDSTSFEFEKTDKIMKNLSKFLGAIKPENLEAKEKKELKENPEIKAVEKSSESENTSEKNVDQKTQNDSTLLQDILQELQQIRVNFSNQHKHKSNTNHPSNSDPIIEKQPIIPKNKFWGGHSMIDKPIDTRIRNIRKGKLLNPFDFDAPKITISELKTTKTEVRGDQKQSKDMKT